VATKTDIIGTSTLINPDERAALLKEADALISRTNREKPDPKAMAELRAAMDKHPEIWHGIYDHGQQTTRAIIEMVNGTGLVMESLRRDVTFRRDEMGYLTATPLEKGLIESVIQAWLIHQNTQHLYARNMKASLTMKQAEYWERKVTMTQHRYLRACETLARVRRLLIPVMQVNVGRQQVNVAGTQVNIPATADETAGAAIDGMARE
jgi:hypothetical protein